MALVHNNPTVGTTPTLIVSMPTGIDYTAVQIYNRDNQAIYIGDYDVTVAVGPAAGSVLASNSSVQLWLNAGDEVWAISTGGTANGAVSVIYSGV